MSPPEIERAGGRTPAPSKTLSDFDSTNPTVGRHVEQRRPAPKLDEAARRKAVEARAARVAEGAKYRRNWLDAGLWDELAKKRGIRLPHWHTAPTPRALKRWHGTLGNEAFEAVYGCTGSRLIALNPDVPLRAFIGQMLEMGGRQ